MKDKIKKVFHLIIEFEYLPFIVLFLLSLIFHLCISDLGFGDDGFFAEQLNNMSLIDFLVSRYNGWSSRTLIELFEVTICRVPDLWRFLDPLVIAIGGIGISKIFNRDKLKSINWLIVFLLLSMSLAIYRTAGWISTTLNYIWPASFGFVAFILYAKVSRKEKIEWYEYIIYSLAFLYAMSHEQMCLIFIIISLGFFAYHLYLNKNINWYYLGGLILSLLFLIYILVAPGNAIRRASEINSWFPDFDNIPFIRKLEMAFSGTMYEYAVKYNTIFVFFSVLLFLNVLSKKRGVASYVISFFPLAGQFAFVVLLKLNLTWHFEDLVLIRDALGRYGTGYIFESFRTWIPLIYLMCFVFSIIYSIIVSFINNKEKCLLVLLILFAGFSSRMAMALSPTIWASVGRTFAFLHYSILVCSIILWDNLESKPTKDVMLVVIASLGLITFFSFCL